MPATDKSAISGAYAQPHITYLFIWCSFPIFLDPLPKPFRQVEQVFRNVLQFQDADCARLVSEFVGLLDHSRCEVHKLYDGGSEAEGSKRINHDTELSDVPVEGEFGGDRQF